VVVLPGVDAAFFPEAPSSSAPDVDVVGDITVSALPEFSRDYRTLGGSGGRPRFVNPVYEPLVGVVDTGVSPNAPYASRVVSRTFDADGTVLNHNCDDDYGHGTAVAALVTDDGVGLAPGVRLAAANVRPAMLRLRGVLAALDWLSRSIPSSGEGPASHRGGCDVINCSWGQPNSPTLLRPMGALVQLGITVVCSVGNRGANLVHDPGGYASCLGIGVSTHSGEFDVGLSAWDSEKPDLCAPGIVESVDVDGHRISLQGSSFSAALVSGAAARLLQSGLVPKDRPDLMHAVLRSLSRPLHQRRGNLRGTTVRLELDWLPDRC
jgi:subtilisin family serine protease